MPTDLPVILLIAVAATAAAFAVLRRTADRDAGNATRTPQTHRPGILAGFADIVDASIGMYLARRLVGRPTTTRADGGAEGARIALAAAEEAEARRAGAVAGAAVVAPTRLVVGGTAASQSRRDRPDLQAHPVAVKGAPAPVRARGSAVPRPVALAGACLFGALAVCLCGLAWAGRRRALRDRDTRAAEPDTGPGDVDADPDRLAGGHVALRRGP